MNVRWEWWTIWWVDPAVRIARVREVAQVVASRFGVPVEEPPVQP